MNASLSLKANTRIIFGCSAIFLLPLLFLLVYIKKILPLRYCRGFVFHTFIGKLSRVYSVCAYLYLSKSASAHTLKKCRDYFGKCAYVISAMYLDLKSNQRNVLLCCRNVTGSGRGVLIPHSRPFSRESRIPHVFHQFPESRFSFPQKYIKKSNFYKS